MNDGTFKKVTGTEKAMYGPRKVLVCGYRPEEQLDFLSLLEQVSLSDLPVVFLADGQTGSTLGQLLSRDDRSGYGQASVGPRAVVLSGVSEKELHAVISAYRSQQFPEQLWATLTPTSEGWPISRLLDELAAEREAFRRMKSRRKKTAKR